MTLWKKIGLAGLAVIVGGPAVAALVGMRPSTGACLEPAAVGQSGSGTVFTPYRVTAADGNCLQGYEWKPAGGAVRGAVVVVHGIHDHARRYDGLARALNEAGVVVYAQDHSGHSTSGGARQRVDSMAQLRGDVDLAVQEAGRRNPGVPVFMHGHSMGGLVAAGYAIEQGGRKLAGVVVSSAALKLPASASGAARAIVGTIATLAPGLGLEAVDEGQVVRDAEARRRMAGDAVLSREKVPARTVAAILGGVVEIGPRMEAMMVPLLVLHGEADRVTEPEGSRALARRAGSADKAIRLYPGALHDLLHEPEGGEVVREIVGFVVARLGG